MHPGLNFAVVQGLRAARGEVVGGGGSKGGSHGMESYPCHRAFSKNCVVHDFALTQFITTGQSGTWNKKQAPALHLLLGEQGLVAHCQNINLWCGLLEWSRMWLVKFGFLLVPWIKLWNCNHYGVMLGF